MANEKMYITGGIGGTQIGEAFSYPYDLPNDTAYAETVLPSVWFSLQEECLRSSRMQNMPMLWKELCTMES